MAPATRYMDAGTNVPPGNSLITGVGIHPILEERSQKGKGRGVVGGGGARGQTTAGGSVGVG